QLCNPLTLAIDVKDTSSAQRAFPGGFSAAQFLRETSYTPIIENRTADYNRRPQKEQGNFMD
ncbi:MAG: hypothetical protein OEL80_04835, partial [Desulfuromonadales bacterium]|nr:hypothetical protein [Desulfuromonadales bacterium]